MPFVITIHEFRPQHGCTQASCRLFGSVSTPQGRHDFWFNESSAGELIALTAIMRQFLKALCDPERVKCPHPRPLMLLWGWSLADPTPSGYLLDHAAHVHRLTADNGQGGAGQGQGVTSTCVLHALQSGQPNHHPWGNVHQWGHHRSRWSGLGVIGFR